MLSSAILIVGAASSRDLPDSANPQIVAKRHSHQTSTSAYIELTMML
jgi:hypothetical protein